MPVKGVCLSIKYKINQAVYTKRRIFKMNLIPMKSGLRVHTSVVFFTVVIYSIATMQAVKYRLYIFVHNNVVNNTEHYAMKCLLLLPFSFTFLTHFQAYKVKQAISSR